MSPPGSVGRSTTEPTSSTSRSPRPTGSAPTWSTPSTRRGRLAPFRSGRREPSGRPPVRRAPHRGGWATATTAQGPWPATPRRSTSRLGLASPGGERGDTADTCHIGGRPIGVLSTFARSRGDRSGYACMAGTSMAAPHVSGALALLLSMGYSHEEALERLVDTAHPGAGLGAGRIDVAAAVAPPWPVGVMNLHDDFDTGTPQLAVARRPPSARSRFPRHLVRRRFRCGRPCSPAAWRSGSSPRLPSACGADGRSGRPSISMTRPQRRI